MTFLPIVERELRVTARKPATFWLRVVAALVALIIGGCVMLLTLIPMGGRMPMGGPIFATLTWLSLAAALSAGLFFTSDCLSEEKREGTLGFLFLTDLRGYDVVLGKLLATSLRCVFALLAIFPVLAITLLMGGVTAGQFWRTILALCHALFFSLAAGMFVSALSHHPQKALAGTLILLVMFLMAGPAVDELIAFNTGHSFSPTFGLASPGYVFLKANGAHGFWPALLVSQGIAWSLLALAGGLIRRTWQEKAAAISPRRMRWRYWWKYGGIQRRTALRQKLLAENPVTWLACRERWQTISVWVVSGTAFGAMIVMLGWEVPPTVWVGWNFVSGLVALGLYLWITSQACQFFADARRSGWIELLLAGPLAARDIVRGSWRGLMRLFAWPVGLFLLTRLVTLIKGQESMIGGITMFGPPNEWQGLLTSFTAVTSTIVIVANLVALVWFGMWMGLTSKNGRLATLKTIVLVQVVPWFVLTLAGGLLLPVFMFLGMKSGGPLTAGWLSLWFPFLSLLLTTVVSLGKDYFFYQLARKRLIGNFRELAIQSMLPIRMAAPGLPPVIALKP